MKNKIGRKFCVVTTKPKHTSPKKKKILQEIRGGFPSILFLLIPFFIFLSPLVAQQGAPSDSQFSGEIPLESAPFSPSMTVSCGEVSLSLPEGWFVHFSNTPVVFSLYAPAETNDDFQENINLVKDTLGLPTTLEEYRSLTLEDLSRYYQDFLLIEEREDALLYRGIVAGVLVEQLQFYRVIDNVAYVFTCSATPSSFERYRDVFEKIASSLTIDGIATTSVQQAFSPSDFPLDKGRRKSSDADGTAYSKGFSFVK